MPRGDGTGCALLRRQPCPARILVEYGIRVFRKPESKGDKYPQPARKLGSPRLVLVVVLHQ